MKGRGRGNTGICDLDQGKGGLNIGKNVNEVGDDTGTREGGEES